MPSGVFAGPPGKIVEFAASPTQHDNENVALPVLQEVEVVCGTEYVLDFQGRKHLDRETSDQQYHFGQPEDASPSYPDFPMSGLASASRLRDFLRQHLQPNEVVDEYGNECDISDICNDHLPFLQAKLWVKVSNNHSPVEAAAQCLSQVQILNAGHVSRILHLLEEKYIFVFNEDSKNGTCNYVGNLPVISKHTCRSQILRIEPVVHWGTVTPASPSHFMLPFRRDGLFMKEHVEYVGYKKLVKRLAANAPAYCIDCLGYLWNKHAEALETVRQLQGTVPPPESRFQKGSPPPQSVLELDAYRLEPKIAGTVSVGRIRGTPTKQVESAADELHKSLREALTQLDGASDHLSEIQMGHSGGKGRDKNAIWIISDSGEPTEKPTVRTRPLQRTNSFTLPLRTPPSSSGHPTLFAPPTRLPASAETKLSSTKENGNTNIFIAQSRSGSQVIDLITPPRAKERKFSQELNANAKTPLVQVRRSPRKHNMDISMSSEIPLAPVKPMKPLKPVQKKKKAAPKATKETKKRKIAPVSEQTVKQKKPRNTAPKECIPLIGMGAARKDPILSQPQSQLQSIPAVGLQCAPKTSLTVKSYSPPKLNLHSAKRPTEADLPEGIAKEEWDVFQSTRPTPTSKICFCNKPACHGKFKKGEDPQIAQCVNKDCRFRWFHYACLDLSEKGKARWGTLLCVICRTERESAEQDEKNGWSVEKMVDFQPVWTKEDIKAQVPGLGGVIPEVDPYGLGLEFQLGPKYERQIKETGTLGEFDRLGYPKPRLEMLEEAYLHTSAYAELLARCVGKGQDDNWEEETYEEDEEHG